ncbi:MAG: threonylcarbamoyl-AMP synthase [Bacteroidia bacterium]|nr:threonylcarbamoyl-AMP synthase [Bacteroidia bacterium]
MKTETGQDLNYAKRLLERGDLVAIPTETVYGLAANALNPDAVIKIFRAKNRPEFNPLIVHCGSWEQVTHFTEDIPAVAEKLAEHFMPGPLTLLLPKKKEIQDLVTSGSDKVAVRIPDHPVSLSLLKMLSFPLAAPSANPSGYISPTTSSHVFQQLNGKIPYILEGGPSKVGLESTIAGFDEEGRLCIYRLGGLSIAEIEKVAGKVRILTHYESKPKTAGQLLSHYAPMTPLMLGNIETMVKEFGKEKAGVLSFRKGNPLISPEFQRILSPTGDTEEAAKNLFRAMRELDGMNLRVIYAEEAPEEGLGPAINDRLRRARYELKLLNEGDELPDLPE